MAVEVLPENEGSGVMWCDGDRMVELPPGARIDVWRSQTPVRLARLTTSPFTDRLVAKFDLPSRDGAVPPGATAHAGLGHRRGAPSTAWGGSGVARTACREPHTRRGADAPPTRHGIPRRLRCRPGCLVRPAGGVGRCG